MRIAAGIVLFNPDKVRFNKCLAIVTQQFDEVILFDNVGNLYEEYAHSNLWTYETENSNKGLAYGLNKIMEIAKEKECDWVVTIDQDTILPSNLLSEYKKYINISDVAILCPQVVDKRRPYMEVETVSSLISDVNFCITSASCTNLKIFEELGGFDEWLFIDFIDNDYCKRVKNGKYRILRINKLVIDQEFGNIELKSPWKVKLYLWLSKVTHNKNVAKLTYKKKVSPLRVYYVHRNLLYLNNKFKDCGGIGYDNFYCKSFVGFLLYFTLPSIVRGTEKVQIIKAVIKGLRDGYNSKV